MKKINLVIIMLILIILSGCSTYVNDGTIRTEEGNSVVRNDTRAVQTEDVLLRIAAGEVEGFASVHKFGAGQLTTTMQPITQSGNYRVPTTATQLEFVSNDVDDTLGGTGAQQITIVGLNSTWQETSMTIDTAGTTPVTLPQNLTRLYRWYVSSSGSYADQTVGSHEGNLEIREVGGGQTWSTILNTPFPVGQSEIGVFTIPKGKNGYLFSKFMFTDTTKTADLFFYGRCFADDVTSPYNGTMRLVEREIGLTGGQDIVYRMPKGPFVGPCDIGFMGKVASGTADASVEFELILIDTE